MNGKVLNIDQKVYFCTLNLRDESTESGWQSYLHFFTSNK